MNSGKYDHRKKPKDNTIITVTGENELMKFLIAGLPHKSRNNIKSLLRDKQVFVDGTCVTQYNHPLKPGQKVEIRKGKVFKEMPLHGISIIYEDEFLVVIDKHAGMLSIATENEKEETAWSMLSNHVKIDDPSGKIFVVHRLDRETSGLMLFAKSEKVQKLLQENWHETVTERTYLAIIEGKMEQPSGIIRSYLNENKAFYVYSSRNPNQGREAVTHYETVKSNKEYSMLKVDLDTGKKHQIRVHMKDAGHPVIGDKKYGSEVNPIGRLGLHSWILAFTHPVTFEPLRFETNVPRKFLRLF